MTQITQDHADLETLERQIEETRETLNRLQAQARVVRQRIGQQQLPAVLEGEQVLGLSLRSLLWAGREGEASAALDLYCQRLGGLHASGINYERDRMCVQVRMDQNLPLDAQLGLMEALKSMTPLQDGSGAHVVQIYNWALSEHGVQALKTWPDGRTVIGLLDGDQDILQEFVGTLEGTLEDALAYIYRHYPLRRKGHGQADEE